jgi:hypothetical protein
MAYLAPSSPEIPSAKTIRRRLQVTVAERQQSVLQKLPRSAKLSVALDCWTSPFQQAFMAITGYFLDIDWNYREILLGFEPLYGTHSGINLSSVLFELFQKHQITNRVLAITTDNASNNNTLMSSIQESIQSLELDHDTTMIRIPCIAHVIQLSLNQLLGQMKANPKNETIEMEWTEANDQETQKDIVNTLNKVRYFSTFLLLCPLFTKLLARFAN